MEYTTLHADLPDVSRIGLGTWAIGGAEWGGTDERRSIDTILAGLDRGINLIDTAPIYGHGTAETIVGKALAEYGRRGDVVVATKAALEWEGRDNVVANATRDRVLKEIDDSLERLQTDYIDLYQMHWPDPLTPIAETAETLAELYDDGVIRTIGVSNYTPAQMKAFQAVAPLHTNQPPYNLFERAIEADVLPFCQQNDVKLLTYSALCRGLLTGKMTVDTTFEGDDLRAGVDPKFQAPRFAQYIEAANRLDRFARERFDKRVIHLAVRWILDQGVDVALWGARRPSQLDPVDGVCDWSLDADARVEIDRILDATIHDPVGPEYLTPDTRDALDEA